jgi:thiol:disulfide interchange protein
MRASMRGFRVIFALLVLVGMGMPLVAASSSANAAHLYVQIVAPENEYYPGGPNKIGIYFKLEPGWHVYWKNAGDSGEPPSVRWTLPEGVSAAELQFPAPKRLPLGPLMDFGYENEVLFPTKLTVAPTVSAGDARFAGKISWLVCREVCIPGKAELETTRHIFPKAPSTTVSVPIEAGTWDRLKGTLPKTSPADWKAVFTTTATGYKLAVLTGQTETEAQFFPAEQDVIDNPAPQTVTPLSNGVALELKKDANATSVAAKLTGVIELSGGRAYEIAAVPGTVPAGSAAKLPGNAGDVWRFAGLAFLGGIILNLLPCVFPVLFIKGLSLVQASREEHGKVVAHGLTYTAGIVASFWVLVGVLLGLRAAGTTLGWGFQFQSPIFVALMAGLLFFLGLSLAGQFEIGLTLTSAGGSLAAKQGYAGSFFTGVLAVIVATPCTAPFMGAAIGFALAQSGIVTFAVFTALGLGLAAPYLLLTIQPAWTRLLPKPGAWMEVLKQAASVPLFGFTIWLVWVLAQTRGSAAVAMLLAVFLFLAIAGWILGRWPAKGAATAAAAVVIVASVGGGLYGILTLTEPVTAATSTATANERWEPWSQAAVDKYRAEGRPVFVDFTASWCLSCQVNERVALRTSAVDAAFKERNVALLKADWTSHDDAITQALASYGRSGVPAYALYASNESTPTLLPEVLTPGIVMDALKKLPAMATASATK